MNEDEQEMAWRKGWRPPGYTAPSDDDLAFSASHPGWVQANWAHPDYKEFVKKRGEAIVRTRKQTQP